jgi:hypothetical protein
LFSEGRILRKLNVISASACSAEELVWKRQSQAKLLQNSIVIFADGSDVILLVHQICWWIICWWIKFAGGLNDVAAAQRRHPIAPHASAGTGKVGGTESAFSGRHEIRNAAW